MADITLFNTDSAKRIVETVRDFERRNQGGVGPPPQRSRQTHGETLIDGKAFGICLKHHLGICKPEYPPDAPDEENIYYWNTLGDVEDEINIVIGYSHRSSMIPERNHNGIPTPWIIVNKSCPEDLA